MTRHSLRRIARVVVIAAAAGTASCVLAQDIVVPNPNLIKVEGIPPIPAALAARTALYTEFRPRSLASWHPAKRELVVATRATNTAQLFAVRTPLGPLVQLTDFAEPVRFGMWWPSKPDVLVFVRDAGGNEQRQLYRLDPKAREPVLLTDPARRNGLAAITRARDRLLITSTDVDQTSGSRENPTLDLTLVDPLAPGRTVRIATLPGTGWGNFSFSFDDRRLAMTEYKSITESYVWVMDVKTGERRRVLPAPGAPTGTTMASREINFSRDGKGLFLTTDRDGEFQRASYLDLASGRLRSFGPSNRDVDQLVLAPDGRTIAMITNEGGRSELRLYDARTLKELPQPVVPVGTVGDIQWHHDAGALAFALDTAQTPGDVYVLDRASNAVTRWTQSTVPGLDASAFRSPQPIRWTSFDGREIAGFIVRPPAELRRAPSGARPDPRRPGKPGAPGLSGPLELHRRPTGHRDHRAQCPRVDRLRQVIRLAGQRREARGLGAGHRRAPRLDRARNPTSTPIGSSSCGGSYGGYMSLAVATSYPERIAGSIDMVGIANFVTFLERTESYRRDLRRAEYGDERDPAMRDFLTRISPVNNAAKIARPLFVAHGRNDPRVPYTEAEQIVETVRRNGTPVWYLLADNEGHGFAKKENADFHFYAIIRFLQETVLK